MSGIDQEDIPSSSSDLQEEARLAQLRDNLPPESVEKLRIEALNKVAAAWEELRGCDDLY